MIIHSIGRLEARYWKWQKTLFTLNDDILQLVLGVHCLLSRLEKGDVIILYEGLQGGTFASLKNCLKPWENTNLCR